MADGWRPRRYHSRLGGGWLFRLRESPSRCPRCLGCAQPVPRMRPGCAQGAQDATNMLPGCIWDASSMRQVCRGHPACDQQMLVRAASWFDMGGQWNIELRVRVSIRFPKLRFGFPFSWLFYADQPTSRQPRSAKFSQGQPRSANASPGQPADGRHRAGGWPAPVRRHPGATLVAAVSSTRNCI